MMLVFFLCAVLFITDVYAGSATSFHDVFIGDWVIVKSTVADGVSPQEFDVIEGTYSIIEDEEDPHLLTGHYYDNDTFTGEVSNNLIVRIIFEPDSNGQAGSFQIGQNEHTLMELFPFNFVPQSNGFSMSHGKWNDEDTQQQTYQFTMYHDRFLISIVDANAPNSLIVFTGKQKPKGDTRTFFDKYGSMAMIGVGILLNGLLKRKQLSNAASASAVPTTRSSSKQD